jgi:hypothetical protein
MKIALIDIGVSKNQIGNGIEVRHFSLDNGELVEKYKEPEEKHGTHCFKEIVSNAKDTELQILDMNISDVSGTLKVSPIIAAIDKALEERVDIINISLGLTAYSQELYDVCEKAAQNNIVVLSAASHTNTISFPADFNNVICVKVDQKQTEKIKTVESTTISVSMRDYIMTENGVELDFSSSSMACARICGYFCDELSAAPLNDKYKILSKKYNINLHGTESIYCDNILEESEIKSIISDNRVAVVIFPSNVIKDVNKNILNKNIVAYYDHEKGAFYNFDYGEETEDFDVIMLLSSLYHDLQFPVAIKEKYKKYRIVYIGNFLGKDDNKYLRDYNKYNASEMTVLEKPVIAVAGLCSGLNKSDVQISLLNKLKEDGLNIKAVSNNPIGVLYDMEVFNYPTELKFPNSVFSINKYMYLTEINEDMDAWLINIGGATGQVNNLNTYNFGKLADAYFSAANIDVAVMCVNTFVDPANLKLQLANLYKHGIENIFIVLSHNDIDAMTMDYKDGLKTYYVDNEKYLEAFEYLKANVKEKVFSMEDVKNGNFYDNIIDVLS